MGLQQQAEQRGHGWLLGMQQCSSNASNNERKSSGMRAAVGHAVGTRMPRSGGAARGSGRTAAAPLGAGRPGSVAFGGHLFWPGIHAYFSVQVLVYRKVGSENLNREAGSFPEKSPEPHGPHANPAHHGHAHSLRVAVFSIVYMEINL